MTEGGDFCQIWLGEQKGLDSAFVRDYFLCDHDIYCPRAIFGRMLSKYWNIVEIIGFVRFTEIIFNF